MMLSISIHLVNGFCECCDRDRDPSESWCWIQVVRGHMFKCICVTVFIFIIGTLFVKHSTLPGLGSIMIMCIIIFFGIMVCAPKPFSLGQNTDKIETNLIKAVVNFGKLEKGKKYVIQGQQKLPFEHTLTVKPLACTDNCAKIKISCTIFNNSCGKIMKVYPNFDHEENIKVKLRDGTAFYAKITHIKYDDKSHIKYIKLRFGRYAFDSSDNELPVDVKSKYMYDKIYSIAPTQFFQWDPKEIDEQYEVKIYN